MVYKIEVAEFLSAEWVSVGMIEKTETDLRMYVCIVKRIYPGCRVRALDSSTSELVYVA